jgi:hypothetical protein
MANFVKIGLLLIALLILPYGDVSAAGPRISFDRETHDYGKVFYGDSVTEQFVVTNTGDETLIIEKLDASCGCTKAVKGSTEIPPHGKSKIVVEFDTKGLKAGRKKQTIHVHSNDPTKPSTKLTLSADVVREVVVEPSKLNKALTNFIKKVSFPLKITNLSSKVFTVTGIRTQEGNPKAELAPNTILVEPRAIVAFTVEIELPPEPGRHLHMGRLALLTDHAREKEIEIPYLIQLDKGKDSGKH